MDDLISINDDAWDVVQKLQNLDYWEFIDTYPLPVFKIEIHSPFHGGRRNEVRNLILESIIVYQLLLKRLEWGAIWDGTNTENGRIHQFIKEILSQKNNNLKQITGVT